MFWVNKGSDILGKDAKSISFHDRYSCTVSPLAGALFKVNGVSSVMLGSNYVTVMKKQGFDWQVVKPSVELVLSQFMDSGIPIIRPDVVERTTSATELPKTDQGSETPSKELSIEDQIKNLIAERVQPFVQQDGGYIDFVHFDEKSGLVQVKMQGACKGCPKSMVTLKLGIERMLRHYIPDVVAVEDVGEKLTQVSEEEREKAKEFGP